MLRRTRLAYARRLRGALLGAGNIAVFHLRAWQAVPDVEIVALANRTRSKAVELGRQFGIDDAHIYADYRELLSSEELDFVDIATAPEVHREQVLAAAACGVNILCQKPFANSLQEAREMVESCQAAGVRCVVNENWRWRSWYRRIKQMLDEGEIGRVRYARFLSHDDQLIPRPGETQPALLVQQSYLAQLSRLILIDWGIHFVDTVRFLLGDIGRVYARVDRTSPLVQGEDRALVVLELAAGPTAVIDLSWHSYVPEDRRWVRGSVDPFVVEGDSGSIELDPYQDNSFLVTTCAGTRRLPALAGMSLAEAYQQSFTDTHRHFVHCLRTGKTAENEASDNLKTLAATFAAYESAERGEPVAVMV